MKKTRISLAIILTLLLTFCLSTVSYADTKETAPQPVPEQQSIVVPMGQICPECEIGTVFISKKYSPYTFLRAYICTTHTHCTVEVWTRTVITTYKCNYCGAGTSITSTENDYRHISTSK